MKSKTIKSENSIPSVMSFNRKKQLWWLCEKEKYDKRFIIIKVRYKSEKQTNKKLIPNLLTDE